MLVQTLIFPVIDYGDVCCYELNTYFFDILDSFLNNCTQILHIAYNHRKYDHVSSCRSQLNWLLIRLHYIL